MLDDVGHGLCFGAAVSNEPTENMEGIMRAGLQFFQVFLQTGGHLALNPSLHTRGWHSVRPASGDVRAP